MAEGYQGLDKGYFVRKQSDLKWVQTFRMTLRSPAVANRIFDTKQHAIDFINDTSDSASAVEGIMKSVEETGKITSDDISTLEQDENFQ